MYSIELSYHIQLKPITFCKHQLSIGKKQMLLTFPQLLALRNKVNSLTTKSSLTKLIYGDNFILLSISDQKHLVYLETDQLLDLRNEIAMFFNDSHLTSF